MRKVAVFDKDYCTWGPNPNLQTDYSQPIPYNGDGFDIKWPDYKVSPDKCFGLKDLKFKGLDGNYIDESIIKVDWVAKTIKYRKPDLAYDYRIKMQPFFNPTTSYVSPGDDVRLLLCILDWYVWLEQPDPKIIPYIDPLWTSYLTGLLNKPGCITEMGGVEVLIFY